MAGLSVENHGHLQAVAETMHGLQRLRGTQRYQLAAQARNVKVDTLRPWIVVIGPQMLAQHVAANRVASGAGEQEQQCMLPWRQPLLMSGIAGDVRAQTYGERFGSRGWRRDVLDHMAQQRLDARFQFH